MNCPHISTEELGKVHIINEQGDQIKLSSLWRERTAVLVFVRHFG